MLKNVSNMNTREFLEILEYVTKHTPRPNTVRSVRYLLKFSKYYVTLGETKDVDNEHAEFLFMWLIDLAEELHAYDRTADNVYVNSIQFDKLRDYASSIQKKKYCECWCI